MNMIANGGECRGNGGGWRSRATLSSHMHEITGKGDEGEGGGAQHFLLMCAKALQRIVAASLAIFLGDHEHTRDVDRDRVLALGRSHSTDTADAITCESLQRPAGKSYIRGDWHKNTALGSRRGWDHFQLLRQ